MSTLEHYEQQGDYLGLIEAVKDTVSRDPRAFADPYIKQWCGRRWRNLFISEAAADPSNVLTGTKSSLLNKADERSDRQKIAERFLRGDNLREWQLDMPEAQMGEIQNTTLVFAPGLLNGMLPSRAFQEAFPALESKYAWSIIRADLHPMRGCSANADDLLQAIQYGRGLNSAAEPIAEEDAVPPRDVFLIGYSKGMPDILTALAENPQIAGRVRCIFSWAGATGGSYLADDIYNSIKDLDLSGVRGTLAKMITVINPLVSIPSAYARMEEFDTISAIRDLTTGTREDFMTQHRDLLDSMNIPIFNLTGSTTMTEVPYFQIQGALELNKYDANNDMQVTQAQAKVDLPMATDLAMLRGHHWDLSYSAFPKTMRMGSPNLDHPFPKEAAAAAMFKLAAELGLID